jgi:putative flippase GtrA
MADYSRREIAVPTDGIADGGNRRSESLLSRLLSLRVAVMLWRNTVVSCSVFLLGLGVLYALVDGAGFPEVPAAGIGFLTANSLHYLFGRSWIFRGSDRGAASGYALFLINAGLGLAVTMALYALLLAYTPLDYIFARVLVSLVAGLVVFVLNAVFNFRRV